MDTEGHLAAHITIVLHHGLNTLHRLPNKILKFSPGNSAIKMVHSTFLRPSEFPGEFLALYDLYLLSDGKILEAT